jgi:hypothetical protein
VRHGFAGSAVEFSKMENREFSTFYGLIDVKVVNDLDSAANTAVPAEFAGLFAVEGFIGYLGLNNGKPRIFTFYGLHGVLSGRGLD